MENKKFIKIFCGVSLLVTLGTLLLSIFYNTAFIPSFMLMLALFIFSVCYYIKDDKKNLMYILFVIGVLLIFASLSYTFMRLV